MSLRRFVAGLLLTVVLLGTAAGENEVGPTWSQWRGPTRDGHVGKAPAWPDKLNKESLKLLWRVDLGPSYSGPVVGADRVFVTETVGGKEEVVKALDRKTGKELWKASWKAQLSVPAYAKANGEWIRSTPAYDGTSVFVNGMRDVLVCLDAATGKESWRADFPTLYKTPQPIFGQVSSPLVDGDAVYTQALAGVFCLDKKTGKVRWRAALDNPREFGAATASPIIGTVAGKRQLIVLQRKVLAGLDLSTGAVQWRHDVPVFRNTSTLTPLLLDGDGVFTSVYGSRSLRFDVTARDNKQTAKLGWENKLNGYMSSPVLVGKHIYLHLENQRVACLDSRTGKQAWLTPKPFGKYWSMVVNGNRILALDQDGTLYLLEANPTRFELIDKHRVSETESWAHLAVVGDRLYIRELEAMAVYQWRQPAPAGKDK